MDAWKTIGMAPSQVYENMELVVTLSSWQLVGSKRCSNLDLQPSPPGPMTPESPAKSSWLEAPRRFPV